MANGVTCGEEGEGERNWEKSQRRLLAVWQSINKLPMNNGPSKMNGHLSPPNSSRILKRDFMRFLLSIDYTILSGFGLCHYISFAIASLRFYSIDKRNR